MHGSRYPSSRLGARYRPADRSLNRQHQIFAVKYIRDQPAMLHSPRTAEGIQRVGQLCSTVGTSG